MKKVVLSFGEFQYPFNDYKGKYGMSQICFGLPISSKKEGDDICEAIKSDIVSSPYCATYIERTPWSSTVPPEYCVVN